MVPSTKTDELVELLKKRYPDEQYAGVSGYLQGVVLLFEKEYKTATNLLQRFIDSVNNELNKQ